MTEKVVTVVAFGNPLLDMSVKINNNSIISKYQLPSNAPIEITEKEMKELLREVISMEPTVSPGGCAQNFLRVLHWTLRTNHIDDLYIYGSVGEDYNAGVLKTLVEDDKINTRYISRKDMLTGTVMALTYGKLRTLAAHIGAARIFSTQDLDLFPDFLKTFKAAEYIYLESFFIPNREKVTEHIRQLCQKYHKNLIFNLGGEYICKQLPKEVYEIMKCADIIIGSLAEFQQTRIENGFNTIDELMDKVSEEQCRCKKIFIITDGENDVVCRHGLEYESIPVLPINFTEIGDTTAAGDAFIAGFITGILYGKTPIDCCKVGRYVAAQIIKQIGCSLPKYPFNMKNVDFT